MSASPNGLLEFANQDLCDTRAGAASGSNYVRIKRFLSRALSSAYMLAPEAPGASLPVEKELPTTMSLYRAAVSCKHSAVRHISGLKLARALLNQSSDLTQNEKTKRHPRAR